MRMRIIMDFIFTNSDYRFLSMMFWFYFENVDCINLSVTIIISFKFMPIVS